MPHGIKGSTPVCLIDGCNRLAAARGWCRTHYDRYQRNGDPMVTIRRPPLKFPANVFTRLRFMENGCVEFTGHKSRGYGKAWDGTANRFTHRLVYEMLVGPVPAGLELDHLCRNRACCNPSHLEPVTHQENTRRSEGPTAVNARKTRCKNGHPLIEGSRDRCKVCRNENDRAERKRRREGVKPR